MKTKNGRRLSHVIYSHTNQWTTIESKWTTHCLVHSLVFSIRTQFTYEQRHQQQQPVAVGTATELGVTIWNPRWHMNLRQKTKWKQFYYIFFFLTIHECNWLHWFWSASNWIFILELYLLKKKKLVSNEQKPLYRWKKKFRLSPKCQWISELSHSRTWYWINRTECAIVKRSWIKSNCKTHDGQNTELLSIVSDKWWNRIPRIVAGCRKRYRHQYARQKYNHQREGNLFSMLCLTWKLRNSVHIVFHHLQLSNQKQINSWAVQDKLSSKVVYDFNKKLYVGVFGHKWIRCWPSDCSDINKIKRIRVSDGLWSR